MSIDEQIITEAGKRIAAAAPDARIILFGSHARGNANLQSDLDLLAIEPVVKNPPKSRYACDVA